MLWTWFAYPLMLIVLAVVPVCAAAMLFGQVRRAKLAQRLAAPLLLRKNVLVRPGARRWKSVLLLTSLALICLAATGPNWGIDPDAQVRKGRDVVVVLDLSRSMNAEQPSRRELALRALRNLADALEVHGGHRVALVAFAAKPALVFPLTHDYDHLRSVLSQVEADDLPLPTAEDAASGTRIGAALQLAAASVDSAKSIRPAIVLLSDGDDPMTDQEWSHGLAAVKSKKLRVHTVGIGNPDQDETIPHGDDVLRHRNGDDGIARSVLTRLREAPLREIAESTGGRYLPAHTSNFALGFFLLKLVDDDAASPDATEAASSLAVYRLRFAWFLLPAVLLLMGTMLLNEGPQPRSTQSEKRTNAIPSAHRRRAGALAFAIVVVLSVSAASPPADDEIRQGNHAFSRGDFETALRHYEQAEELVNDPGLVSFNKGAAYFRLGRHKEAIESYRRCLDDDRAPIGRRVRAHFNLGNTLAAYAERSHYAPAEVAALGLAMAHHAGDDGFALTQAIAEYRACLALLKPSDPMRDEVRHNLEQAQLRLHKARARMPADKSGEVAPYPKQDTPKEVAYKPVDPGKSPQRVESDDVPIASDKPRHLRSAGTPVVLADDERVQALSPDQTLATLAEHARRIAAARRQQLHPSGPGVLLKKDW